MIAEFVREAFIYKGNGEDGNIYDLVILPEIARKVMVAITARGEKAGLLIASFYPEIAKQIYFKHLQKLEAERIIWVERIIYSISEAVFFEVALSWDEATQAFILPTGSLVVNKLSFL